jgi:methyl-accepting chemotaxis protein
MNTRRYAIYGALFGCFFPVGATFFQALLGGGDGGFGARVLHAQSLPLLWVIDSAPLFLGLFAALAGRRQDQLVAAEAAKRAAFEKTSTELSGEAKELLSTVSLFSSLTTETSASVRETTATMQQLSQTAARAALTAETVVGLADATVRRSADSTRAVETSSGELTRLASEVRTLSTRIQGLNDRMRDIFEIASVMSYSAERSEALAAKAVAEMERNPAVRPFAPIVADMKRQAEEGKASALRVKRILADAHKAMLAAMTEAQHGVIRAEEGAVVATATKETLEQLVQALHESSQAAREIAQVAQQQDRGIDQVLQAMNEIFLATEETVEGTRRVAGGAKLLSDLAGRLDGSVRNGAAANGARAASGANGAHGGNGAVAPASAVAAAQRAMPRA